MLSAHKKTAFRGPRCRPRKRVSRFPRWQDGAAGTLLGPEAAETLPFTATPPVFPKLTPGHEAAFRYKLSHPPPTLLSDPTRVRAQLAGLRPRPQPPCLPSPSLVLRNQGQECSRNLLETRPWPVDDNGSIRVSGTHSGYATLSAAFEPVDATGSQQG